MKIVIFGGDSMIGAELATYLRSAGHYVLQTSRRIETISNDRLYIDLANVSAGVLEKLSHQKIDCVILCGGITSLAECESDPNTSHQVNVCGNIIIAKHFLSRKTRVVFLSSSAVFDGTVDSPTPDAFASPCSEYGRQKLLVENQLLAFDDSVTIIRLTKVIGKANKLLSHWTQELRAQKTIHPLLGVKIAPLSLDYAVRLVASIILNVKAGILHAAPSGQLSYCDVAKYIASRINAPDDLVIPIYPDISTGVYTKNANLGGTVAGDCIPAKPGPYDAVDEFLLKSGFIHA